VRKQIIDDEKVVADDFCIDMHVLNVNRDEKERHKFRTIGARVENECEKFNFPFYREYYENFYQSQTKEE
jgi:hypothetical protein